MLPCGQSNSGRGRRCALCHGALVLSSMQECRRCCCLGLAYIMRKLLSYEQLAVPGHGSQYLGASSASSLASKEVAKCLPCTFRWFPNRKQPCKMGEGSCRRADPTRMTLLLENHAGPNSEFLHWSSSERDIWRWACLRRAGKATEVCNW